MNLEMLETELDRGVVSPSHPPIIAVAKLSASKKNLKAGTVLSNAGAGLEPASASSGSGETAKAASVPYGILVEDVEAHDNPVTARVLVHGIVVESRLIDASGETEKAADSSLTSQLPDIGIYLTQAGWDESRFN